MGTVLEDVLGDSGGVVGPTCAGVGVVVVPVVVVFAGAGVFVGAVVFAGAVVVGLVVVVLVPA